MTMAPAHAAESIFQYNQHLGRGINLGNALDAPKESEWGVTLQADYFRLIKEAGFDHVRLPVRWETHCAGTAPYTIDPAFFERVDWAIAEARRNQLMIVVNMHHHEAFEKDPDGQKERFLAMWRQIAERYREAPPEVAFEIYNEPSKNIDAQKWNDFFGEALKIVRRTNHDRCVVVGPVQWNSIDQLPSLELPADPQLLVTVHYYQPFHFTHQGASWAGPESTKWLGTKWTGSPTEIAAIAADFAKAAAWGEAHHRPIYLGEFGAFSKADIDSRALWTAAVSRQAAARGFSSAYWEFCSGFGAYDPEAKEWRKPLLDALLRRK
ncbi:MAG: cellulase family glycosylhydrolase [Cyanobacteria bacterium REEB67]|nr:cellulase family glycosylhydrolase [Cyanobacteria bacterium REEB67]